MSSKRMCICIARYGMKVLYRCYKLPGYGSKCHERDDGNHCMKCKYAKAEMSASDATRLISSYDIQPEIPPYVAEIEAEYKKWVNVPYIRKPLAKALYEVWKKHDREDAERRTDG